MKYDIVYAGFISLVAHCAALKFSPFENVTDGIWDDWERENPEKVKGHSQFSRQRFGIQYGNDRLWLVSRRQHITGMQDSWDAAVHGGIVSTLRIQNATWSHATNYGRLDEDEYKDKLFSLNGRLFMLTYRTNEHKVVYHKLFFWEDENVRWLEIPFKVDHEVPTLATNSVPFGHLSVSVPRQNGRTAIFVASTLVYGSVMVYAMLQVQFWGSVPTEAELKFQARVQSDESSAVFFTALRNNTLFGFVQNLVSEGWVARYGYAYALDLTTNNVTKVTLTGDAPPMLFEDERMFQTRDDLFIVGGIQIPGLALVAEVKDIWSLHFDTLQWRGTNGKIPRDFGVMPAYNQQCAKLYLTGLKEGVKVAHVYA